MSYTKTQEGWPDFYSDADLTAMAAIRGWRMTDQEWLIRDRNNNTLLFTADDANERLQEENGGDLVIGKAPDEPRNRSSPLVKTEQSCRSVNWSPVNGTTAGNMNPNGQHNPIQLTNKPVFWSYTATAMTACH